MIIVEDVPLELKGTEGIFKTDIPEAEIIGTAENEPAYWRLIKAQKPDLVLLDLGLGGSTTIGVEICRSTKQQYPDVKVLIFTGEILNEKLWVDALDAGLKIVKFFPANVYGGLDAMKALASAFVGVKFMPTGGINAKNLAEYLSAPFIHAVGGTWLCSRTDIAAHNFDRITALCREARKIALGYELAHVGVNTDGRASALEISGEWEKTFGFAAAEGNSSCFAGTEIEVMNRRYLGENGHIGIATRSMERAIDDMEKRGFSLDMDTAKYSGERIKAVYLKNEIGGFAVHLMQK